MDRDLAERLAVEDQREGDPMSDAGALDAIPAYDEAHLPDPFAAPPKELGGL